jgi:hypothetical protein
MDLLFMLILRTFLIGCILLTKSLSRNTAISIGMPYIPKSSKYLEFISLRWKEPYYDKFQCHKLQEGYFSVQGRFCANSNSKKSDPLFSSERRGNTVRTPVKAQQELGFPL